MYEFKVTKAQISYRWIFMTLALGIFTLLGLLPLFLGTPIYLLITLPIITTINVLGIMGNLDMQRERLIVEEDKLTSYGYFKPKKRELYFDEIKGYRENPGYLLLIPKDKQKKRIKVSRGVVGYDDLFSWISQTFEACDVIEQREVEQKKLNEKKNAPIKEINQEKLALAKKTAIVINTLGAISLLWGMISDMSDYAIFTILAIPIIAIFAILYFEGYIQMIHGECEFPSVIFAFGFSSIAMITGAVGKYNIYEFSNVWLKTSLVVLSLLLLLIMGRNQITPMFKKIQDYGSILFITFLFFLYSFGAVFYINCRYDNTTPQHYIVRITEKGKNRSKTMTLYRLKVSSWGPKNKTEDLSVSKSLYDSKEIGDSIHISLKKGLFSIPWYVIDEKEYNQ